MGGTAIGQRPGCRGSQDLDRTAADELFARRKAETEQSPEDWRCWYRLAAAYYAAKDSSRAREAMRHAVKLATPHHPAEA